MVNSVRKFGACECTFRCTALMFFFCVSVFQPFSAQTQSKVRQAGTPISRELFGLFFEDINYSADGGLYAELIQNRSFEYSPTEQREWHPLSFWEYLSPGFSYGQISIETKDPVHTNNPHYLLLNIEHVGHEEQHSGPSGVGIRNAGFDGIVIKKGERYNFSVFAKQVSSSPVAVSVSLQTHKGEILAEEKISINSPEWKKYTGDLVAREATDSAKLVLLAETTGTIALDVISLFPEHTFKNRPNGLRADLAQVLADMKPRFIRFPGGCLVHGDGLGNMYRWKNTIGPIEQRVEQRNIWGYHQTAGLGYFEYFQFCEDIGAKPVPVLPAAVSCQNSGGTWRIGGTGQRALPLDEMDDYVQEVLDLIEWANGPPTSKWGSLRAAAGHPEPFNLEYIGIGNEDKITPEFKQRFKMIYDAVRAKHPEITIIGTVGPFPDGEDFTKGWEYADALKVPVIDEHYYKEPQWFINNQYRYDGYDRDKAHVYLGEYASWGNKMHNAIAEAIYMVGLERNGDVVRMASYAPLLAKKGRTQWKTDLIFFDNKAICLTPNYYVQQLFSLNQGDVVFKDVFSIAPADSTLAASCVRESSSGDLILKIVNGGKTQRDVKADLTSFGRISATAEQIVLSGDADAENTFENPTKISPVRSTVKVQKAFSYAAPAMSLTVIRIKFR